MLRLRKNPASKSKTREIKLLISPCVSRFTGVIVGVVFHFVVGSAAAVVVVAEVVVVVVVGQEITPPLPREQFCPRCPVRCGHPRIPG